MQYIKEHYNKMTIAEAMKIAKTNNCKFYALFYSAPEEVSGVAFFKSDVINDDFKLEEVAHWSAGVLCVFIHSRHFDKALIKDKDVFGFYDGFTELRPIS